MVLAVLAACSQPAAGPLLVPDAPPAHPDCGGPVLVLGATQLQRAYGVPAMLAAGIDGAGTTIADIVPYANPQAAADLAIAVRRPGRIA
jgi:hypothetical protein